MNDIRGIKNPIYLLISLVVMTVLLTLAKQSVVLYERSVVVQEAQENRDIGERAILEYYLSKPVTDYLEYKKLKILRRIDKYQFEVLSSTKANLANAKILWADYAVFKDKDGRYIPRTSPCLTKPTTDAKLKAFCLEQAKKYWFQFQFWIKESVTREGEKDDVWIYKHWLIPPDAVEMEICSDQTITVHRNKRIGDAVKLQHVCSEPFDLRVTYYDD